MSVKYIQPDIALFSQWLSFRLSNNQFSDNVYFEYNCKDVKIEYFEHVMRQLVQNHDILRYCFCVSDNALTIKVDDPENIQVTVHYMDYGNMENLEADASCIADRELKRPFNLESAPLFRSYLVRWRESDFKFVFIIPHVLVDTHTLHMFYDETDTIVRRIRQDGSYPALSADDVQFTSHINDQNNLACNLNHPSNLYWLSHFKEGVSSVFLGDKSNSETIIRSKKEYELAVKKFLQKEGLELNFSLVLLLNSFKRFKYITYIQILQKHQLDRLEQLARISNTTIFSIMVSCYYMLVHKISRQAHITLSYTLSTRNSIVRQKASGSFLNHIFIQQDVNENMAVLEFIRDTHHRINQMKANCDASMPLVWHEAGLPAYINIPLDINYFINQHHVITEEISGKEGIHSRQDGEFGFDIALKAIQGTDGIVLCYNYREEFFSREYIEEFTETLSCIVSQVTDTPYAPVKYCLGTVYDVI